MKTSNKILTGIVLVFLLIPALPVATVYLKYRNGHVIARQHNSAYVDHSLEGVRYLMVDGLANLRVIPADSAKMEVANSETDTTFHIRRQADSLIVWVDSTRNTETVSYSYNEYHSRSFREVRLYLPPGIRLQAQRSELMVEGSRDPLRSASLAIDLVESGCQLSNFDFIRDSLPVFFNEVKIAAARSKITVDNEVHVNRFDLLLDDTQLTEEFLQTDSLLISTDKRSKLSLSGENLAKMKLRLR